MDIILFFTILSILYSLSIHIGLIYKTDSLTWIEGVLILGLTFLAHRIREVLSVKDKS